MPDTAISPPPPAAIDALRGETHASTVDGGAHVRRRTVVAEKDPRVARPASASAGPDWTESLSSFTPEVAECLVALSRTLCPHDWLEDVTYRSVVLNIDRESGNAAVISDGVNALLAKTSGWFGGLTRPECVALLQSVEHTPFFRTLLGRTVRHLYDDPVVWAGCGYEGTFGCRGLDRREAIDDLDWLPEPDLA